MPARFKTECDRSRADPDCAQQRDDGQSSIRAREKFYPAKINRSQHSGESDTAEVGLGEIGRKAKPENKRNCEHDPERHRFATVAILPIAT